MYASRWLTVGIFSVALLALLSIPQQSWAVGSEYTLSGSDLQININAKWAGCREGGYFPLRVKVNNIGPARTITLDFRAASNSLPLPMVTRNLTLEQNATVQTTLLIPMVNYSYYGSFRVLEEGRPLKNMSQSINLPEIAEAGVQSPQMLIVSSTIEDGQFFSQVYQNQSPYHHGVTENTENVAPASLPANWVAYTGLDLLAIPLKTFERDCSPEVRQAILQWVESGGRMIVYGVGQEQAALDKLLNWNQRGFAEGGWQPAQPLRFRVIHLMDPADSSRTIPEKITGADTWKVSADTFALRNLGLGQVVRMQDNPFPGTVSHWSWLIGQFDGEEIVWSKRNGINARTGNSTFLQFLIPGVGGVPVFSFLILITLFTLVIGPLNYVYFLKKKRLALLLVTVPVLAFGSSLLLLGYSTIANGFSTKSRIRSVTILDQKQNSSLSFSRVAYFSGMAPLGGLNFEPTTAVFPIWPTENAFEAGRVDWSEGQHFQNGWLRSRTRTQFLVVSQREQRGRLSLKTSGETAQLTNGLEWLLEMLIVKDATGKFWFAERVSPGAVVELKPADAELRSRFRNRLMTDELGLPEGLSQEQAQQIVAQVANPRTYYNMYGQTYQDNYRNSQQEQLIKQMQLLSETDQQKMASNSYYAILRNSPDLDLGLSQTSERASQHLLMGYLD